jgi:glucose/arabinose dehydrogenase
MRSPPVSSAASASAIAEKDYQAPVLTVPGHWVPNDLLFYTAESFPAEARGGAFIAVHGSWNRAPRCSGTRTMPSSGRWVWRKARTALTRYRGDLRGLTESPDRACCNVFCMAERLAYHVE